MAKMFPFIVKDMKDVLIYLPQALCACGIYAVCYGLAMLVTGVFAGKLQEGGGHPTADPYRQPARKQPERGELSKRWYRWLKNTGHFLGSSLFIIYLWMLVMIVFFCREPGSRIGTNLQVLGTWGTTMQDHAWVIENIFLFLPFGFLLPICFSSKKAFLTIPAGFLCSVAIEYFQLRTGRGFCQLDDVIMNTLGAVIGFLCWKIAHSVCRHFKSI